jgi:hypothetical protein
MTRVRAVDIIIVPPRRGEYSQDEGGEKSGMPNRRGGAATQHDLLFCSGLQPPVTRGALKAEGWREEKDESGGHLANIKYT